MSDKDNIDDAQSDLSQLVGRPEPEEEISMTHRGRPAARMLPFRTEDVKRKRGRMRGRIRIGADFDAPIPGNIFGRDDIPSVCANMKKP
jgi:antitoxin (DNA-binding transcriptional repressor) of toxin-antitoxin stability system